LSTAAAYWSGRVALRNCDPKGHIAWLKRAAHYSGTFYGLLAARTLGVKADFNWRLPELGPEHMTALCRHPAGVRALALMETGRWDRIESELMLIRPGNNIRLRDALLALSETLRLPAAALRLGSLIAPCTNGARFDAALYPIPPWRPEGGYTVDEALVFALMRQESRFDTEARNPSGASGLMQLMPATAHWVAGDKSAHGDALFDPAVNIGLGQRYIEMMLKYPAIDGNLLKLAVAYNGGPGNLNRWMREMDTGNDPLLFLESIPAAETRAFAAHVLANYWIYRLRLGRDTPSLTRIASGDWPLYPYHATVQVQMAEDDRQLK
ncbi:MAG: lytic transglycosylase domain-containing protein, partial [Pseudomonadota bacterium]|nr:lytic transglycosylase domain-containing protein [Pseudomonadota bacterium]